MTLRLGRQSHQNLTLFSTPAGGRLRLVLVLELVFQFGRNLPTCVLPVPVLFVQLLLVDYSWHREWPMTQF